MNFCLPVPISFPLKALLQWISWLTSRIRVDDLHSELGGGELSQQHISSTVGRMQVRPVQELSDIQEFN